MISEELKELDCIGDLAAACLRAGKLKEARRHFNSLRGSPYILEAMQAEARALLEYFRSKADGEEARRYIRQNLLYLWGEPELLSSSNFINEPVSHESKLFKIQFTGTTVLLGGFSAFDNRYICTFEAIAPTSSKAVEYFLEIIPVDDVRTMRVIKIESWKTLPDTVKYEGLIQTYPFRIARRIEQSRKPLLDIKEYLPRDFEENVPVPSIALSQYITEMMSGPRSRPEYL